VVNNRDVWGRFLERNQLPGSRTHAVAVVEAQARLAQALNSGEPGPDWEKLAQNLIDVYVGERESIMRSRGDAAPASYVPRKTPCPQPAVKLSPTEKPAIGPMTRSPNEFYPNSSRRAELEGAVIVAVQVDLAGCARKMGVVASSGSEELDQAGIEFMDTLEFLPAQHQGQAVEGVYKTVVKFKFTE
jgi:TonB family protein